MRTLLDEAKEHIVKGEIDLAVQKLGLFLNDDFFHDEALFMLGACLQDKGLSGMSAVLTSAAIDARATKNKHFPEALLNLGAAYKAEHRNDVAERIWLDALTKEMVPSERAKILTNLSGLHVNEGSPERAIEYCDKALAEDQHCAGAKANRGLAHLELGRWREGWAGFRATYATGDRNRRTYGEIPEWDGSEGKTVIVWGDQGVGDEIYYSNCFADMQARCSKVILDCHPRLPALFKRSFPEMEVHGTRKHLTKLDWLDGCGADAAIAMADLPGFFRNSDEEWKGAPWLKADVEKTRRPRMRIGLSWTGGTKRTRTDLRSIPLAAFKPILKAMPFVDWCSLQYTPNAAREVCELEEQTGIRISHFPGQVECYDYDRTASFVAGLDLVITVCTTVHHLAGALGVPTWTLVPSRPSWRYQSTSDRLPWYDSVRLFRQSEDGNWAGPIQRIVHEISEFRRKAA